MNRLERLRIIALNLATGFLISLVAVSVEPLLPPQTNDIPFLLEILMTVVAVVFFFTLLITIFWSAIMLVDELIAFVSEGWDHGE